MGTRPWATQGPAGKLRSSISDMAFLWILGQSVSLLPRVLRKILVTTNAFMTLWFAFFPF